MKCPNCGFEGVLDNEKFCGKCGANILHDKREKEMKEKTRIFGVIRNSRNRDPVKAASIKFSIEGTELATVSSNEEGEYEYTTEEGYTGQTLDFVIQKEGFIRKDISHEIDRFEIESDFQMDEIEIKIKGKIYDETDSPLDNASVRFSIGDSTIDLVSDKDGSFSFTVGQQFLNQIIGYKVNKAGFKIKSGKLTLLENLKYINLSKSIPPKVPDKSKWIQIAVAGIGLIVLIGLAIYLFALPSGPGSIDITSTPSGASIYLDGSNKGVTPKTISGVSAGSHTIKITKSGYEDYNKKVTVTAGETASISVDLVKQTGSIYVTSIPSGADIYLDGSNKGTTPKTISKVSAGSHTIKVTAGGYEDYLKRVTVTAGETASVSVDLVKQTGSIDVTSIPSGATFYLDGSYKGTTPKTISEVSAGSHTIKITKSGYEDYNKQVTVTAGEKKAVFAELVIQTGSIDVTSVPSGASFYLDGSYKGTTPKTISEVSAGSHTIKITKSGYKDYNKQVTVTAGEKKAVIAELIIQTGSIDVTSVPSGASFYLDGSYKGTTPKTISGVSAGSHTIKITKSEYEDYNKQVTVTAGETTYVKAPLTPYKHFISNIQLDPPSPKTLLINSQVEIKFDYATTETGGVRIFVRPFTDGSLTPNYAASGSPLYPTGKGIGGGYFTIRSNEVTVDHLRFKMTNADQSKVLYESFISVNYRFLYAK